MYTNSSNPGSTGLSYLPPPLPFSWEHAFHSSTLCELLLSLTPTTQRVLSPSFNPNCTKNNSRQLHNRSLASYAPSLLNTLLLLLHWLPNKVIKQKYFYLKDGSMFNVIWTLKFTPVSKLYSQNSMQVFWLQKRLHSHVILAPNVPVLFHAHPSKSVQPSVPSRGHVSLWTSSSNSGICWFSTNLI